MLKTLKSQAELRSAVSIDKLNNFRKFVYNVPTAGAHVSFFESVSVWHSLQLHAAQETHSMI